MYNLEYLEYHVIHSCNLKCQGCSHFSHITKGGSKTNVDLLQELEPWTKRINIESFCLMGGEPLLNQNIKSIIETARALLPTSKINITTNGLLLNNSCLDFDTLKENDISLIVSLHSYSKKYLEKFDTVRNKIFDWRNSGLKIDIRNSVLNWSKRYHEENGKILPFSDNDIQKSYNICMAKKCKQLHEKKLWKCPPAAYINLINSSNEWDLMKKYKGLEINCTDDELSSFLKKEEESICSHCPSSFLNQIKFNESKTL